MSTIVGDTRRHLTRSERDLLAAISRYCRAAGWRFGGARGGLGDFVAPDKSLDVDWWSYRRGTSTVLQISTLSQYGTHNGSICHAEISAVREVVDIGCALGLLPADFSSAASTASYTSPLLLRADQFDVGWLLLDASDETTWHPVTAVLECEEDHAETYVHPEVGEMPGYMAGRCGHRVAQSEWRAGFRVCERCTFDSPDNDCMVVVSAAYQAGEAHLRAAETASVRIPAGEL